MPHKSALLTPLLSVIVPMYNEEKRMEPFLSQLCSFLKTKYSTDTIELLVVDDGSLDGTAEKARAILKTMALGKVLSYTPNRGKGLAVKYGVEHAKGDFMLFIDADGSTAPQEIPKLVFALLHADVAVGSREHQQSEIIISTRRKLAGKLFNLYVRLLFQSAVRDNLCGFKGFRRTAAKQLFSELRTPRWIFDVELFWRVKQHHYTLAQVPIVWNWKRGSKIQWYDPLIMAWQLLMLRLRLMEEPIKR